MKKISLFILAIMLTITSCKNYDDDFKDLNKSIAELQAQVAGFSSLQAGITALQSSVASLQTTVNALPTTQVDLSGLEADLTAALANIASLQADLNTVIANYATSTDLSTAQASIDALTTALAAAQADLDELLASNNVYDGNLTITNDAQLTFAESLGAKVTIVNGDVTVDIVTNSLDAAAVSAVTSQIMSATGFVKIATDASLDFSALTSVGGLYNVAGSLTTLTTGGADIEDAALTSVGGAVTLNYDGGYDQPNLASAASVTLTDYTTTGTTIVGTLSVNFRDLTSGLINAGTLSLSSATSVILNKGVTNLTANAATDVQIWASNSAALTISATEDDSVITIAGTVNADSTTGGPLSVTGSATSVLNVAALTKTSTLTVIDIATALSFPVLTKATAVTADATISFSAPLLAAATTVSAAAATSFTAPLLVASTSVSLAAAKTVSLASTPILNAAVVETLTFSNLDEALSLASMTKLVTLSSTGKTSAAGITVTSANTDLVTANLAGKHGTVSITGPGASTDKLTSLTTSGTIAELSIINNWKLVTPTLGHTEDAVLGAKLTITGNTAMTSFATAINRVKTFVVTGNTKLASFSAASMTGLPLNSTSGSTYLISVTGNHTGTTFATATGLKGAFVAAAAATGTTPATDAIYKQNSLNTLKPYIAAVYAAALATTPTAAATGSNISVDYIYDVSTVATTASIVNASPLDATGKAEFAKIAAE